MSSTQDAQFRSFLSSNGRRITIALITLPDSNHERLHYKVGWAACSPHEVGGFNRKRGQMIAAGRANGMEPWIVVSDRTTNRRVCTSPDGWTVEGRADGTQTWASFFDECFKSETAYRLWRAHGNGE